MKKSILLFIAFATSFTIHSQSVQFNFEGASADMLLFSKKAVEVNVSRLLTEINRADMGNSSLNLSAVDMDTEAKNKLNLLWSNMHFACEDIENVEKCLPDAQGYQIRNIPVTVHPLDTAYQGEKHKTISISLNRKGQITGLHISLTQQDYVKVMDSGRAITDERQRREILKLIEEYRCYYNAKDIHLLQHFYSSGIVVVKDSSMQFVKGTTTIDQSAATEYLKRIHHLFGNSGFVDVNFEDIVVKRSLHDGKENWYEVTLKQKLQADSYSDECYLFLLIEFKDYGEPPVIHVKTLLPIKHPDGTPLEEEEIFSMIDFFIP